jgi:lysophospholipase L1-like esterase
MRRTRLSGWLSGRLAGSLAVFLLLTALVAACRTARRQIALTEIATPGTETRAAAAGWLNGGDWRAQHDEIARIAREQPLDLVFLGDSITQSWGDPKRAVAAPGRAAWKAHFGTLRAASFGISGDRTQHVLWRVEQLEFPFGAPRVIVLLIGTNNLSAGDSPADVARGIRAIVARIRERWPVSKLVLLGVLPRGESADDPLRSAARAVNLEIRGLGDGRGVYFRDLEQLYIDADGRALGERLAGDHLHLTSAGYTAWAEGLAPLLRECLPLLPDRLQL